MSSNLNQQFNQLSQINQFMNNQSGQDEFVSFYLYNQILILFKIESKSRFPRSELYAI